MKHGDTYFSSGDPMTLAESQTPMAAKMEIGGRCSPTVGILDNECLRRCVLAMISATLS
jgi:hypothetical protein